MKSSHRFPLRRQIVWGMRFFTFLTSLAVGAALFILSNQYVRANSLQAANVFAQFGQRVKAGQTVALSGERLHIEVKFKGEELNPIEFLTMLYGNIKALQEADGNGAASFYDAEAGVKNDYEKDQREIEELMLRFLPLYMEDLQRGAYTVPAHTEQSLRHIFTMGAAKEYFYEKMPSMYNPLGLGRKAMPLACKVQNLLIADFLNYLALRHDVYLSATGGEVKKNFMTKP